MAKQDDRAPTGTFDDLELPPALREALRVMDYASPTPVQHAVYRPAMAGADLVVQARTGTGKTCAFGLPVVSALSPKAGRATPAGVRTLILCPTRELALQVSRELSRMAEGSGLEIVAVYGGAPMQKQVDTLRAGAAIVVGTPGRVLDHLRRGTLDPSTVQTFVLDECDEMLSMGFLPQINDIWEQLSPKLQVLLFSATVPREVVRIAETRLKDAQFITLSGDHVGALEIAHFAYLSRGDRFSELLQIIEVENPESAIIFCNTREDTKRAAGMLKDAGFDADWLNADLAQKDREKVMQATRDSKLRFLVCTDVAARGIDISHLTHVINLDFPEAAEQYVHRTGRTGRAGRMGTAISLVSAGAIGNLYHLRLLYNIRPIEKQLPSREELQTRKEADVLRLLADEVLALRPDAKCRALARRLLTLDNVEDVLAGMLAAKYGTAEAETQAANARRKRAPRPVVERAEQASAVPPGEDSSAPRKRSADRQSSSDARRSTEKSPTAEPRRSRERDDAQGSTRSSERDADRRRTRTRSRYQVEDGIGYQVEDGIGYQVEDGNVSAKESASAPKQARPPARDGAEIYVNVGRRDGASEDNFHAVLAHAGVSLDDVSYVNVRQNHTFVGVSKGGLDAAVAALNGAKIADRDAMAEPARSRRAS